MSERPLDVIGLGFSCLDHLCLVPELPTLDRGASLLEYECQGGGPAATATAALAKLGAKTGFVTALGDDGRGRQMLAELKKYGVDTSQVVIKEGASSPLSVILVHQPTGKRSIMCTGQTAPAPEEHELDVEYLCSAQWLHLDGAVPVGDGVLKEVKDRGGKISVDMGRTALDAEWVSLVDLFIWSHPCGAEGPDVSELSEQCLAALDRGPEVAGATLGEHGFFFATSQGAYLTKPYAVEAVDTTGAGDVFHGAFLYGMLQGWRVEKVAEFACAVAALSCTRLGGRSGIPDVEAALEFLGW